MPDFHALRWTGPDDLRSQLAALPDPRHRRGPVTGSTSSGCAPSAVLGDQRHSVAISD